MYWYKDLGGAGIKIDKGCPLATKGAFGPPSSIISDGRGDYVFSRDIEFSGDEADLYGMCILHEEPWYRLGMSYWT
jgi:hypothetical protein